jgi:hypothetical protein
MDTDPEKVIQLVDNKKTAIALWTHGRNKNVINTSGAYYYLDKEGKYRILSGLLPRLRSVYWPNNSIYQQMKSVKKRGRGKGGRGGRFSGVIRGSQIHRELRDFVVLDGKNFKKNHKRLHPYSSRILRVIIETMQLQPFLPEHDIYDDDLGIGTSVDMICLDKDGRLVLLEFKTGYKDYFENADGYMQHCLAKMRNTIQNQATLQLSSAALILEKKYEIPLSDMRLYIIRVDDESIDVVPVDNTFVKTFGPSIYKDLFTVHS